MGVRKEYLEVSVRGREVCVRVRMHFHPHTLKTLLERCSVQTGPSSRNNQPILKSYEVCGHLEEKGFLAMPCNAF